MAWWPVRFCRKFPSGNFHTLMLSGEADAKENLKQRESHLNNVHLVSYSLWCLLKKLSHATIPLIFFFFCLLIHTVQSSCKTLIVDRTEN